MTLVRSVFSSFAISSICRFIAKNTSAEPSTTGGGTNVEPPPIPEEKGCVVGEWMYEWMCGVIDR